MATALDNSQSSSFLLMLTGQIESAQFMGLPNIYCKYCFVYGIDWSVISGIEEGISQITKTNDTAAFVNHFSLNFPLELTFRSSNPTGWPQLILSCYGTDAIGNDVVRGYGATRIPITPGSKHVRVPMFVPQSSSPIQAAMSWILGRQPEFVDTRIVAQAEGREVTRVKTQGFVDISFHVITKDMKRLGYDTHPETLRIISEFPLPALATSKAASDPAASDKDLTASKRGSASDDSTSGDPQELSTSSAKDLSQSLRETLSIKEHEIEASQPSTSGYQSGPGLSERGARGARVPRPKSVRPRGSEESLQDQRHQPQKDQEQQQQLTTLEHLDSTQPDTPSISDDPSQSKPEPRKRSRARSFFKRGKSQDSEEEPEISGEGTAGASNEGFASDESKPEPEKQRSQSGSRTSSEDEASPAPRDSAALTRSWTDSPSSRDSAGSSKPDVAGTGSAFVQRPPRRLSSASKRLDTVSEHSEMEEIE